MQLSFGANKKTPVDCRTLPVTFMAALSINLIAPALASDFSQAKKVYAPASAYERRIDYSLIQEQNSRPKTNGSKAVPKTTSTAKTQTKTAAKPASSKSSAQPASQAAAASPAKTAKVTTIAEGTPPPPPLNGKAASGQSMASIAKSLSAKVPPGAIEKMKKTAQDLQKSGKLDEAQRVLTKVAQLTPEDKANLQAVASLSVQRARNYLKNNNYHDAILAARQALAASPNDPSAQGVLSDLYKKVGADPDNVESRLQTAASLHSQGRLREAEVEYKASLAVKPTPQAYAGLGKVAEKMHGAGAGKEHFQKALELDSNHAPAHKELGIMHLNKGDVVSANSHLSRALILDPKDKEASQHLVKLWQNQVSKMPNANSHLGLARAYQLSGDLQTAQAEYREVVRLEPSHPYLPAARQSFKIALAKQEAEKSFNAARSLESQGLLRDAYQKAAEASAYSPGNSNYKIFQAEMLERLGQGAQARQVYLSVLKDDPQNLIAAQKLKVLPELAAGGLGAAGIASSFIPPSALSAAPSGHPEGFPGSKFPTGMLSPSLVQSGIGNGTTADHVGSLSNFMGDLRNHMLLQNEKNKKAEDSVHKVIKKLTAPEEEAAPAAIAAGGPADAGSGDISEAISKILAGGSAAAAPAAASTSGVESGAASALASAASALAAAKSAGSPAAAIAPAAASSPEVKSSTTQKPAATAVSAPSAAERLRELEKQNQALREQLKSMNSQAPAQTPQAQAVPFYTPAPQSASSAGIYTGGNETMSSQLPPIAPPPAAAFYPSQTQAFNPLTAGSQQAQSIFPASSAAGAAMAVAANANPLTAANSSQPIDLSTLRGPIASEPIRFELKNIKPTLREVQLKVSLKNDSNNPLAIPANMKAIIKYPDQSESELKVAFDGRSVAAHSSLEGVVKVPFSKVDPSADLILRNLLPGNADLHVNKTALSQGLPPL